MSEQPDAWRDEDGEVVYLNLRKHPNLQGMYDADRRATPLWFTTTDPLTPTEREADRNASESRAGGAR